MNLLLGYYKPQSGEILINDSNAFCVKQLNEKIAIMRQDPVLFNDTLRNNLTMYRDMCDDELIALLQKLNLLKFATPEGLDSMICEGGSNLSGGERKRIALARTLLRKAPITIIDLAAANVDSETAEKIEDILTELSGGIFLLSPIIFRMIRKRLLQKSSALVIAAWNKGEYEVENRKSKQGMCIGFRDIGRLLSALFIIMPFLFTGASCEEAHYIPHAATDYGDIWINGENGFFPANGLIAAISEEMDMRWFARSLANTESFLRPETI